MGRTSDARERLVASGRQLIHERGYNAVGVSEVCSKAGVNKGSFYHFFPSKQELALEVIDSFWEGALEGLEAMACRRGSALQALDEFLERVYETQREAHRECGQIQGCPLGNLALEMSTQDPAIKTKLRELFDRQALYFRQVVDRGVESGELPAQDGHQTALGILALMEGTLMLAKTRGEPGLLKSLVPQVRRLIGVADSP